MARLGAGFFPLILYLSRGILFDEVGNLVEYVGILHHLVAQGFVLFAERAEKSCSVAQKTRSQLSVSCHEDFPFRVRFFRCGQRST